MGWNGSRAAEVPQEKTSEASRGGGGSGLIRGLVACVIVIVGAVAAWFMFSPPAAKAPPPTKSGRPSRIAETKPNLPTAKNVIEEDDKESADEPIEPEKPKSDIGRQVTNSYGKVYTIKYVSRPGVRYENGKVIEEKPLFESDALNDLDALYRTEPGLRIYGSFDAEAFDKDFVTGQFEKIEISTDDSDDVARRKKMVKDGIEFLRAQIKQGVNPSEVIIEARKEIADLANFKDICQDAIVQMKNDGCSDEDLEFYYEKVNEKLAARNIPGLLSPAAVRERLQAHSLLRNGGNR